MKQDFIVIGGGIAGTSVGARLSHLGRVTVLEAEPALGYHSSGRSAAMFIETHGSKPVVALNRASRAWLAETGVMVSRGMLVVARAEDRTLFEDETDALELRVLDFEEARALVPVLNPDTTAYAGFQEAAFDLDTDLMIQTFAREIRANSGQVLTGHRVTRIARTDAGWCVETGLAAFEGAVVVNAAGAWVDQVARMAGVEPLGFAPMRRSMARLPAPGGQDISGWPMVEGAGERWYCKPDAGKLIVSPAEEDPMDPHDAFADDMVLAEGLTRYEEMVTTPVTRVESNWAGLRTFSPDRLLVIGFDPRAEGFFWHAGQGGFGFETAPAASVLAADIVAGRPPEMGTGMAGTLSPVRFGR
ncbi:NAD(P)/FAD-dependent oxidoreductase [Rhodovulum imhoffii]|nr:FAD-binding oxidoreductase [Rhodovulum imhoffii]MBK5934801.1 glycerol-3-phosphate dehydrogenase [Rhodovulum imhoffii]